MRRPIEIYIAAAWVSSIPNVQIDLWTSQLAEQAVSAIAYDVGIGDLLISIAAFPPGVRGGCSNTCGSVKK